MANIVQFVVDDTSPSISYLPFGDTLSLPDRSAGWNPFFSESGFADAQGVTGNGTSLHVTSHDGATLIVNWQGTTVQLQGNVTDASYTVELDGQAVPVEDVQNLSQNVLATFEGLSNTPHTASITALIPSDKRTESSLVVFDQAIIAARPPNLEPSTPDNVYVSSSLNSQSIAFSGRWSFISEGNTNRHLSQSPGDRATVRFRGTAFLLRGTTSPSSGWYSVTLDNQTTTLSARSSFLAHDSLLYYATALEPNATHTITIANEGEGQLALSEDGFRAFAVGSPDPDPTDVPPAIVQASSSLPKATIAALVLGAVLGCLFLCAILFVFCVCLPRRRRDRERMSWRQNVARSRHSYTEPRPSKAGEAYPSIIDITHPDRRQPTDADIEPQYQGSPPRSGRSKLTGFLRWKREVETSVARRSLGIDFAHSPEENGQAQLDEKMFQARQQGTDETESSPMSTTRSLSSIAFRASRMVRKPFEKWGRTYTAATSSTTDGNAQERSWSPSYQINLPFQPPLVRTQASNGDLGSEFYPAPPPSYAASVMSNVGNSTRLPSLPRSVGHDSSVPANSASATPESRRQSVGMLAVPRQSYGGSEADIDANTPPVALREFSHEDRGSVHEHESGDEDPRLLGTNSERYVLRSLSPRTSRATPSANVPPPKRKKVPEEFREAQPDVQQPPSSFPPPSVPSPATRARLSLAQVQHQTRPLPPVPSRPASLQNSTDEPSITSLNQRKAGPEPTIRQLPTPDAPLASSSDSPAPPSAPPTIITSAPSPIRVRHSNPPLAPRGGRPPPVSMLRRQPSDANLTHRRVSLLRFAPDVEQRRAFRLTPPVSFIPFPVQRRPSTDTNSTNHNRYSYIDFTSSSEAGSFLSRNPSTSSARDVRRYSTPPILPLPLPEERSRWSSSSTSGGEGVSSSGTSGLTFSKSRAGSKASSRAGVGDDKGTSKGASQNGSGSSGSPGTKATRRSVPAQIAIPSNDRFVQPGRLSTISTSDDGPQPLNNVVESPVSDNNSPAISTGTAEFRYPSSDDNAPGPSGGRGGWFAARRQQRNSILGQMSPFQAIPPSPPSSELRHLEEESDSVIGPLPTGLSSPNYIVQRVLGLNSPVPLTAPASVDTHNELQAQLSAARAQSTSSISQTLHESSTQQRQQHQHLRSRSASTLALLTSSLTSRFPTNSRGQSGGQSQTDLKDIFRTL